MNRFRKLIKQSKTASDAVKWLLYEEIQIKKVIEIEEANNIELPNFVKDALIDCWQLSEQKHAFIEMKQIRNKAAMWLLDNKVIEPIFRFANGKTAICQIKNMPPDWKTYKDYASELKAISNEIINKTFTEGMKIFD